MSGRKHEFWPLSKIVLGMQNRVTVWTLPHQSFPLFEVDAKPEIARLLPSKGERASMPLTALGIGLLTPILLWSWGFARGS